MLHEEPFLSAGHSARFREDCSFLCCALPVPTRTFHTYSDTAGCHKRHSAAQMEFGSFSCDALVLVCGAKWIRWPEKPIEAQQLLA